jgi:hypothetical protein
MRALRSLTLVLFTLVAAPAKAQQGISLLPKSYVLSDSIQGDLNKDGLPDLVLLIKGTDPAMVVTDRFDKQVDRNRRGLIVLIQEKNGYRKLLENLQCFSSENEDGGVYFPPDLTIEISKGNLFIHYGHGRYGYKEYQFRLKGKDLELIGFHRSENHGPVTNLEVSINFLTGKKKTKLNTNEKAEGGDEVFKTTWETFKPGKPVKLSAVKDFDELHPDYAPIP